tara:strand:+ start:23125 stop:23307 length:183 start_codon:yes stop_codon:yes gene_type:complete
MKEFRTRHELTQKKAAEVLGYSDSRAIRLIESGDRQLSGQAKKAMEYYSKLAKIKKMEEV